METINVQKMVSYMAVCPNCGKREGSNTKPIDNDYFQCLDCKKIYKITIEEKINYGEN